MSSEPLARGAEPAPGYEVIEHLSRGRRLDVYDAWSAERGCRCVIKALRPERAHEATARELLVREGRLLERLGHPHLVRAYETLLDPAPMIVLETLGGQTLAHMIEEEQRPLAPVELGHLGLHLGSAVGYLHRNGFLHLDLKPSNVVADGGRAKLIDLSLARPPGPAPAGIGTWCYLAPEQASGGELGPAADVWGIGVVLFEAATGQPAFDDPGHESDDLPSTDADGSMTWASYDGDYPQLERRAPRVANVAPAPPAIAELIDGCLEPAPEDRPPLDRLLGELETVAAPPEHERRWSLGAVDRDRRPLRA
ncbi:MAG: serine/threonine-protein kinase [Solirubrobacterales bacterium]